MAPEWYGLRLRPVTILVVELCPCACTDDFFVFSVYPNGTVCISILHPPGDDPNHYEHASERWSPIQSVEKILISVMSMLAEPNDESPANVEAAKMWRERRPEYEQKVRDEVRKGLGL